MNKAIDIYKQAVVTIDAYVSRRYRRPTAGSYMVGARTKDEAIELVKSFVGNIGSVKFNCWEKPAKMEVGYKEIKKLYAYDKPALNVLDINNMQKLKEKE